MNKVNRINTSMKECIVKIWILFFLLIVWRKKTQRNKHVKMSNGSPFSRNSVEHTQLVLKYFCVSTKAFHRNECEVSRCCFFTN